jgi:hypothetical protein
MDTNMRKDRRGILGTRRGKKKKQRQKGRKEGKEGGLVGK